MIKTNKFSFQGITVETEFPESTVPCGKCYDCCSKLSPFLTEDEFKSGKYAYTFIVMPGSDVPAIAVPRTPSGGCMYLIDNKCSIYNDRPKACKQFDCRTPETGHPKVTNKFSYEAL